MHLTQPFELGKEKLKVKNTKINFLCFIFLFRGREGNWFSRKVERIWEEFADGKCMIKMYCIKIN